MTPERVRHIGFLRTLERPYKIPAGVIAALTEEAYEDLRASPDADKAMCDLTLTPMEYDLSIAFNTPRMQNRPSSTAVYVPCPMCAHIAPSMGFSLCQLCHDYRRVCVEINVTQDTWVWSMQPFVRMCNAWARSTYSVP